MDGLNRTTSRAIAGRADGSAEPSPAARREQFNAGHSLVEILVVVAIITIILSILIPAACKLIKAVHHLKGG